MTMNDWPGFSGKGGVSRAGIETQPPLESMPSPPSAGKQDPFSRGLVRCAVVVDTRNVHGMARKVFGRGIRPQADGIRRALRKYGLEVVEIHAGVATKTIASSPSSRAVRAAQDNVSYAVRLAGDGVVVHAGCIADRDGDIEEKQVDVRLAVTVCELSDRYQTLERPFDCVVVLSEDMDLMPSYEYARSRGVPVYAVAHDTHHTRDDQHKWFLIDEHSLAQITPPPASISLGDPMRRLIAKMATSTAPPTAPSWKFEHPTDGGYIFSNSKGIRGVYRTGAKYTQGHRLNLYGVGLELETKGGRFPLVTLDVARPQASVFPGVEYATVLTWRNPTQIRIKLDDGMGEATLRATPGHVLPGQRIAVWSDPSGSTAGTHYVGIVGEKVSWESWPLEHPFGVVTIATEGHSNATWTCTLDGFPTRVKVPKDFLKHAKPGDRLRVAVAKETADGTVIAQPLTCCLPL